MNNKKYQLGLCIKSMCYNNIVKNGYCKDHFKNIRKGKQNKRPPTHHNGSLKKHLTFVPKNLCIIGECCNLAVRRGTCLEHQEGNYEINRQSGIRCSVSSGSRYGSINP